MDALGQFEQVVLTAILALGALVLSPVVMAIDPEPVWGDFHITWNHARVNVPVIWSLCASSALALFYLVMKR